MLLTSAKTTKLSAPTNDLTLIGSQNINGTGNTLNNIIIGNTGNNILKGLNGDDTLDGGSGKNTLTGGKGNDSFIISAGINAITDFGNGVDTISISGGIANITIVSAISSQNTIENKGSAYLLTKGYDVDLSSASGINGYTLTNTGKSATLVGSIRADTITSGKGNDTINPGDGNDTLYIPNGKTTITDFENGDTVIVSKGASAIITLAQDMFSSPWVGSSDISNNGKVSIYVNDRNADLHAALGHNGFTISNADDTQQAVNLIGSNNADIIIGGTLDDTLQGGAGNDTLTGGGGNDTFYFNTAPNANTNVDTITHFNTGGTDSFFGGSFLQFNHHIFSALGNAGAFTTDDTRFFKSANGKGYDADARLIYNTSNGTLSYDADGSGSTPAIKIAILGAHTALNATDIIIV